MVRTWASLVPERQALQSEKYFSSQDTMRPIQTTRFPGIINHIIMELRLFAKHILLLMIICITAAPRGRDTLYKVHRKNILIWSSVSDSATIWLSQTCEDWEKGTESARTMVWSQALTRERNCSGSQKLIYSRTRSCTYISWIVLWCTNYNIACPPLLSLCCVK